MVSAKALLFSVVVACLLTGASAGEDEHYSSNSYKHLSGAATFGKTAYFPLAIHIALEFPPGANVTALESEYDPGVYTGLYFPRVDELSQLRANFTQYMTIVKGAIVRIWLQFGFSNVRSESRVILNTTGKHRLVGSSAASVVLDKGVPVDIVWDDDCSACTSDLCLDSTCSSDTNKLSISCLDSKAIKDDPYRCGIKVIVGWKGTDSDGLDLFSSDNLPSKFQKYSFFMSAYDSVSGFSQDFLEFWTSPLN